MRQHNICLKRRLRYHWQTVEVRITPVVSNTSLWFSSAQLTSGLAIGDGSDPYTTGLDRVFCRPLFCLPMNHLSDLVAKYKEFHDPEDTPLEFLLKFGSQIDSRIDMAVLLRHLYNLGLPDCSRVIGDYVHATGQERTKGNH